MSEDVFTQSGAYEGPLAGLNVLDFGHYLAGPLAGMLLADQGANVIRIVKPGEFELPQAQHRVLNRNKKLVTIDLKSEKGRSEALSLAAAADVVIENFRPGVVERLQIDYACVKAVNGGVVYLSLPGFAPNDPRAQMQAWEGVLGAAAGLYTDISEIHKYLGYPPVYSWVPLCSVYGAMTGTIAVMAALVARIRSGCGARIEVPLVEAGLEGFGFDFCASNGPGGIRLRSVDAQKFREEIDVWRWCGEELYRYDPADSPEQRKQKLFDAHRALWSGPIVHLYPCHDGREIFISFAPGAMTKRLMKALGIDEVLTREGFVYAGTWKVDLDNNLDSPGSLSADRKGRLKQLIGDVLLTRPAEQWEDDLAEIAPVVMNRTRSEWLSSKPMLDSGVLMKMTNTNSELIAPGRFVDISGPGDAILEGYAEPEYVGFEEALKRFDDGRRLQSTPKEGSLSAPKENSGPTKGELLQGLRVLDLSNGLAGPTSAFSLAQYGADVIKIDPPNWMIPSGPHLMLEVNQSKRSALIDLKTAPGQRILRRLVKWADIVVHNTLDGTAERLGVGRDQLRAINSDVVACQVSCLGGSRRGYWERRPGFDPIAQMISGMMSHFGSFEEPMMHGKTITTDNLGGFGLALSALIGIFQLRSTGFAGEGRCSLARVCNYIQLPYMIAENGQSFWGEDHGPLAVGDRWYQRIYACRDGWIYVSAREDQASRFAHILGLEPAPAEEVVERTLVKQPLAFWESEFAQADIACQRVTSITDVCEERTVRHVDNYEKDEVASGVGEVLCWDDHPCGSSIILKAPDWVRVGDRASWKRLCPAPRFGAHTREVLAELGYGPEEIETLLRLGVAHDFMPGLGDKDTYFFRAGSHG